MTAEQKQCLLRFLGYYRGAVDGIWGDASRQATREFQKDFGLEPDNVFGPDSQRRILAVLGEGISREELWGDIRYFKREEFQCRCGGKYCDGFPAEPSETLVRLAERVREHFGAPAIVSSGVRCPTHNAKVGGVSGSRHLSGTAMDFCVAGIPARQVLEYVHAQPETRYAYDIDGLYLHMDVAEA